MFGNGWMDLLICASAIYGLSLLTGWGICALLFPEDDPLSFYFAFWIGIVLSSIILIMLGFLGIAADKSCYAVLAAGLAAAVWARRRGKPFPKPKLLLAHGAFVFLLTAMAMGPLLVRTKTLTSFSTGNMDIYDYVMTADYLKTRTVKPFLTPLGQNPRWDDATLQERVVAWQIPSTRWVSYYFLTLVSVLLQRDPADLFSLYVAMLLALFIPLTYRLARDVFLLNTFYSACAFLLIALNPHILYIVYHGFLPQIMGTGFLICFISALSRIPQRASLKDFIPIGIFSAAVMGSYPEMFTFLLIMTAAYCAWRAAFEGVSIAKNAALFAAVFAAPIFLFPYQYYRFWPMMVFNTQIGGGWDVTPAYYLFAFALGGFFSHPHFPRPEPVLEWLANPILILVLAAGILASPRRGLILSVFSPFLLAGAMSYFRDWNYRYFKNVTYCYYWIALALSHSVQTLLARARGGPPWGNVIYFSARAAKIVLIALIVAGAAKSFEAAGLAYKSELLPYRLKALETWNADPGIKVVLMEGLDRWQGMWAAYYLRNKIVALTEPNSYMRSEYKSDTESYPYVLTSTDRAARYTGAQTLLESDSVAFIKIPANPKTPAKLR